MARFLIVALVVLANSVLTAPVGVDAQQTGIAADIRQGNCDEFGDIIAPLVAATIPAGERSGSAAAIPAASSFTTIPISLDALTEGNHSIVVPFPAGEEIVACGEIGGPLTEAGALVIGLSPQGDVGISGIAYLSPSADPALTNVSIFITGEDLDSFLATTFLPPTTVAEDDAARFAELLAARDDADRLAGPFANRLVQQAGRRVVRGAGITVADFSATVTFVNPTEQTETPWDVGLGFHVDLARNVAQEIVVGSNGFLSYQDGVAGTLRVEPITAFDATPGATNTLDLVVAGTTALFGLNGQLLVRLDLPPAIASDVFVTTDFASERIVNGRVITYTDFTVWA